MMNRGKSIGCVVRLAVFCMFAAVGMRSHASADNDPASQLFQTPQSSAQLVSAVQGTGDLAAIPVALHIVLQPGWKTYWRSPGDAGYPLMVDVNGIDQCGGGESGVAGAASLPAVRVADLRLWRGGRVPADGDAGHARRADRAQGQDPLSGLREGLHPAGCRARARSAARRVRRPPATRRWSTGSPRWCRTAASASAGRWSGSRSTSRTSSWSMPSSTGEVFDAPDVIVEGAPHFYFGPPKVELSVDRQTARLYVPVERLRQGRRAQRRRPHADVLRRRCAAWRRSRAPDRRSSAAASISSWISLLPILGIALLGGLILNIMPCVLPVLLLKLTGVLDLTGREAIATARRVPVDRRRHRHVVPGPGRRSRRRSSWRAPASAGASSSSSRLPRR